MKIKNNVLIKVDDIDVNVDGTFTIPERVTKIGFRAFFKNSALKKIIIPETITLIASAAFENCLHLNTVIFSNKITKIEYATFLYCSSLRNISFSESITEIGESAFEKCIALKKILIPQTVQSISFNAFAGCLSLNTINVLGYETKIAHSSFLKCPLVQNFTIGDIDIIKLYEASEQEIKGKIFRIQDISDAAAFATLKKFYIADENNDFACKYENNIFKIAIATPETEKYIQRVLMPLLMQIQAKRIFL